MVSTKLVEGRVGSSPGSWPFYLVEVHHSRLAPIMGLDRLWRGFDRLDTVPHIRSLGSVAVVGDTLVIGIGGSSVTAWSYDVRTKELTRSPAPDWFNSSWVTPPAAFSPDGRFIAYLSQDSDTTRLTVRSWPEGRVVAQSPPVSPRQLNPPHSGRIMWGNPKELHASFPVFDSGPSIASLHGVVRGDEIEVVKWMIYPDYNDPNVRRPPPPPEPPVQPVAARDSAKDMEAGRAEAALARAAKIGRSGDTIVLRAATLIAVLRRTPWRAQPPLPPLEALDQQLTRATAEVRDSLTRRPIPMRLLVADDFWVKTDRGIERLETWEWKEPKYFLVPPDRQLRTLDGPWRAAEVMAEIDWYLMPTSQPREDQWDRAARLTKRLPPSAFPELPKPFAAELEQLRCTIPQSGYGGERGNVIHGNFAAPGQEDWAVLCSRGGASVILVFWGGPVQCPRELGLAEDKSFLQTVGGGRIGFSRGISTRNSYHVYPSEDSAGVEREVELEHDGIDSAFEGKASSVLFCRAGKWISFSGAD